jgi:hypothetical protein
MFPLAKVTGHSQSEIDLFYYFCNLIKEDKSIIDYNWISETRGIDVSDWLKELIRKNEL